MTVTRKFVASVPEQSCLIDVGKVAVLLACSVKQIYRMADSGRMPRPVKLGRLNRWRRDEIEAWIQAGCPQLVRGR
jgi:excisionase family DNA binding protein